MQFKFVGALDTNKTYFILKILKLLTYFPEQGVTLNGQDEKLKKTLPWGDF